MHLEGSGKEVTIITVPAEAAIGVSCANLTNVKISGLGIMGYRTCCRWSLTLIDLLDSTFVTINDNYIDGGNEYREIGINVSGSSSNVIITDNYVTNFDDGIGNGTGIAGGSYVLNNSITGCGTGLSSPGNAINNRIFNNTMGIRAGDNTVVSSNIITGNYTGIGANGSPSIIGNTIISNVRWGILSSTSPTITNNRITGNPTDIALSYPFEGRPTINFNTMDTITGSGGRGKYNVSSDGNDILIP